MSATFDRSGFKSTDVQAQLAGEILDFLAQASGGSPQR
jgi:hypothetical protein